MKDIIKNKFTVFVLGVITIVDILAGAMSTTYSAGSVIILWTLYGLYRCALLLK